MSLSSARSGMVRHEFELEVGSQRMRQLIASRTDKHGTALLVHGEENQAPASLLIPSRFHHIDSSDRVIIAWDLVRIFTWLSVDEKSLKYWIDEILAFEVAAEWIKASGICYSKA